MLRCFERAIVPVAAKNESAALDRNGPSHQVLDAVINSDQMSELFRRNPEGLKCGKIGGHTPDEIAQVVLRVRRCLPLLHFADD